MAEPNNTIRSLTTKDLARFFSKIKVSTEHFYNGSPCWDWQRSLNNGGYGRFTVYGNRVHAQRAAYIMFVSEKVNGLEVDHLCRRPICANPAHMEAVTSQINVLRGVSPIADHARMTHCTNGHPLTPDNLVQLTTRRIRRCKICHRETAKKSRNVDVEATRAKQLAYRVKNRDRINQLQRERAKRRRSS